MPLNRFVSFLLLAPIALPLAVQAQSIFGTNLIVNGGAEAGPGVGGNTITASIPGWTSSGANVITYVSGYGIGVNDIVPTSAGANYFSNGSTSSSMTQTISLAAGAATIDAGTSTFDVSGYFGGYSNYDDNATLVVAFLNAGGNPLSSVSIGGVKSADRAGTGLYLRRQIGAIPAGTRSATVTVNFIELTSSTNNSGADNLSLVLNSPATLPTVFGSNVIVNGNSENVLFLPTDSEFASDLPNWVRTAQFTSNAYGLSGSDLDFTSPAPPDAGKYYFVGGPSTAASTSTISSSASPTSSPMPARAASPTSPPAPASTRSSSTAASGSARPT